MSENKFIVVKFLSGHKTVAETNTNYMLPTYDAKAVCILLNYVIRNGEIPKEIDTYKWWNKDKFKEYYEETDWKMVKE